MGGCVEPDGGALSKRAPRNRRRPIARPRAKVISLRFATSRSAAGRHRIPPERRPPSRKASRRFASTRNCPIRRSNMCASCMREKRCERIWHSRKACGRHQSCLRSAALIPTRSIGANAQRNFCTSASACFVLTCQALGRRRSKSILALRTCIRVRSIIY